MYKENQIFSAANGSYLANFGLIAGIINQSILHPEMFFEDCLTPDPLGANHRFLEKLHLHQAQYLTALGKALGQRPFGKKELHQLVSRLPAEEMHHLCGPVLRDLFIQMFKTDKTIEFEFAQLFLDESQEGSKRYPMSEDTLKYIGEQFGLSFSIKRIPEDASTSFEIDTYQEKQDDKIEEMEEMEEMEETTIKPTFRICGDLWERDVTFLDNTLLGREENMELKDMKHMVDPFESFSKLSKTVSPEKLYDNSPFDYLKKCLSDSHLKELLLANQFCNTRFNTEIVVEGERDCVLGWEGTRVSNVQIVLHMINNKGENLPLFTAKLALDPDTPRESGTPVIWHQDFITDGAKQLLLRNYKPVDVNIDNENFKCLRTSINQKISNNAQFIREISRRNPDWAQKIYQQSLGRNMTPGDTARYNVALASAFVQCLQNKLASAEPHPVTGKKEAYIAKLIDSAVDDMPAICPTRSKRRTRTIEAPRASMTPMHDLKAKRHDEELLAKRYLRSKGGKGKSYRPKFGR